MYDDVHCMEAELGAVKGQRRAKLEASDIGTVCTGVCSSFLGEH